MARNSETQLFVGIDVGATKILAAVVDGSGEVLDRTRRPTPTDGGPKDALAAIIEAARQVLESAGVRAKKLSGIGLAVPGVVDPEQGRVICTPNMNLAPLKIVPPVERKFGVGVSLGNDVNMGILGEKWLGAARQARTAVGIFVGTGIGGGIVMDGRLVRGAREAAGEVGHIVMQVDGPLCGCGNRGCLEALASRWAIERDIREAIAAGRESAVAELLGKEGRSIKSKALKRALKRKDPVVTEIMERAAEVLGHACLTVRHLLDPEVIVLGGGVIEACGKFVMPIVHRIVSGDALKGAKAPGRPAGCRVVRSELGDDAVVLGAVALARQATGDAGATTPPKPPRST